MRYSCLQSTKIYFIRRNDTVLLCFKPVYVNKSHLILNFYLFIFLLIFCASSTFLFILLICKMLQLSCSFPKSSDILFFISFIYLKLFKTYLFKMHLVQICYFIILRKIVKFLRILEILNNLNYFEQNANVEIFNLEYISVG